MNNKSSLMSLLAIVGVLFFSFTAGVSAAGSLAEENSEDARVMIFGGTGRLGSDIAKALVKQGHEVIIFARVASNRERLAGVPVAFVIGDVLEPESIDRALLEQAVDVVIDALSRGSADVDFYTESARNIAASAARTDVQQIILHGSVGAGDSVAVLEYDSLPKSMQRLMDSKTQGEEAVVGSGVNYTIIRNSHLVSYGVAESGNAKLYEDQTVTGSVTRQGLARLTESCILNLECFNKIYHAVDTTFNKKD